MKILNTKGGVKQKDIDPIEYRGRSGSLEKFSVRLLGNCYIDPRKPSTLILFHHEFK